MTHDQNSYKPAARSLPSLEDAIEARGLSVRRWRSHRGDRYHVTDGRRTLFAGDPVTVWAWLKSGHAPGQIECSCAATGKVWQDRFSPATGHYTEDRRCELCDGTGYLMPECTRCETAAVTNEDITGDPNEPVVCAQCCTLSEDAGFHFARLDAEDSAARTGKPHAVVKTDRGLYQSFPAVHIAKPRRHF